jgi:hypothetical protein
MQLLKIQIQKYLIGLYLILQILYSKTRVKFISSKSLKDKAKKGLKIIEQKLLKFGS